MRNNEKHYSRVFGATSIYRRSGILVRKNITCQVRALGQIAVPWKTKTHDGQVASRRPPPSDGHSCQRGTGCQGSKPFSALDAAGVLIWVLLWGLDGPQ